MAKDNLTIFQRLNNVFKTSNRVGISDDVLTKKFVDNKILYSTNDKADYEKQLAALKQQKYLSYQWKKAGADNAMSSIAGYTAVKLMYRDVDLMDGTPEIGTALDIVSEETCPITSDGSMLIIESSSKRIKSILEDLFVKRLHVYTELPMVARHLAKYGNTFELLNIDRKNGILGWMMLPVYEVDRIENGYGASYSGVFGGANDIKPDEVKFVWLGHNQSNPYQNWQMAHFRLLNDSFFLPYGVSMLHKARRAWRMWSMMEDAMLIWRLDKAIERRIFKIYVGNIDNEDVPALIDEMANRFKRTEIIDPETGQIDLRKNFLDVSRDFFIPIRNESAPTPIENLSAGNSQVQMEDIEYMQEKMLCAMRVPRQFLNFKEAQGKGQNLSFTDVRFARMVNRIQQFLLMELNKIAMIHLYILGFRDDLTNFKLSLHNPSSQIESQELDDLTKRINTLQTALADPGNGIPMLSLHKGLRDIMKMSDEEIKDMLNEIRIEKAMAAELAATANIIKKTGIFDTVDRIYGDFDVVNGNVQQQQANTQGDEGGAGLGGLGGGGGIGGIGDMGDDMDFGGPGDEGLGDIGGTSGEATMENAPDVDAGTPLMEQKFKKVKSFTKQYFDLLSEKSVPISDKAFDFTELTKHLNKNAEKIIDNVTNLND